jgi:hypothetical protein
MLSNLFRYADLETQFTYVVKQGKFTVNLNSKYPLLLLLR